DKLRHLRQTSSVGNYVHAFQNLMVELPLMHESDRLDRFLRGLKPHVYERVVMQQPQNLSEACRLANVVDTIKFNARAPAFGRLWNPARPSRPRPTEPEPMDIDAIDEDANEPELDAISLQQRYKLTAKELEQLKKDGKCFVCKKSGHVARDCSSNKGS